MQEDIYQGDGLDLYVYCHNNPIMYYDPSGFVPLNKKGYNVYGLYDHGVDDPYYIGITDDLDRRTKDHIKSGRLDEKKSFLHPMKKDILYGESRGYEQYYIEKYKTLTGIRKDEISSTNRGNKNNSFRKTRTDKRAECFKATYQYLVDKEAETKSQDKIYGGSGCQK
jgi:hypothetical protein